MKAHIIHDGDQWVVAIYDKDDKPVRVKLPLSAATVAAMDLMETGVIDQIDTFNERGEHVQTVARTRAGEASERIE